eukprot:snap_masked-scaffold_2-processed-gene-3.1-mRNA-1 protein AED:0.01 eAED:0.01 QI:0/-1/0/1/-1/1/1/0/206
MNEIKLSSTRDERRRYDDEADFYSVIIATEYLEKSFIRDHITAEEYTKACKKLISQFKTTERALNLNAMDFIKKYNIHCPLAIERLLHAGVPATILHNSESTQQKSSTILVAEATQEFITCMDVLRLDQKAVDEVQPVLSSLLSALNRLDKIINSENFLQVKISLQEWLQQLNALRASNELSDEQVRQLILDLDNGYAVFKTCLSG